MILTRRLRRIHKLANLLTDIGDYIAVAGEAYRIRSDDKWESNSSPIVSPSVDKAPFFVAWTDNRDVRGNVAMIGDPMPFSPPDIDLPQMSSAEVPDNLDEDPEVLLAGATPEPPAGRELTSEGLDGADMSIQACSPGAGAQ